MRKDTPQRWHEKDGVIYLDPMTSDGTTGYEWEGRLNCSWWGFRPSFAATQVLDSRDFKPTIRKTYHIAILPGKIWNDSERVTKNVLDEAKRRNFTTPNAEVACLIRENYLDEEIKAMGFIWIVVKHKPIKDYYGECRELGATHNQGGGWLEAYRDRPGHVWHRDSGFAFIVPKSALRR